MTIKAIKSAGDGGHITIVESNHSVNYSGIIPSKLTVVYPEREFSYNAYLNLGAAVGNAQYIFFGNNDLLFTKNWDINIIQAMEQYEADSASPICPISHSKLGIKENSGILAGHDIYSRFCGWAYMWSRKLFDEAGGFDEDFTFWCSDNATVEQLIKYKKKHILVTSSIVHHLAAGNNTINQMSADIVESFTVQEIEKYNKKYNRNLKMDSSWILPKGLQ